MQQPTPKRTFIGTESQQTAGELPSRNKRRLFQLFSRKRRSPVKTGKKQIVLVVDKRQKFVFAVLFLSVAIFIAEYVGLRFINSGFFISAALAILTDLLLYWSVRSDLKENFTFNVFILPFFYTLAFGMFYFLIPARIISRIILTVLYAFGLYSLFLSQNIFVVAAIRTIALLSGARIVSFVVTLLSFFFLSNILFSLHLNIFATICIVALYAYFLVQHSVWTYTLQRSVLAQHITVIGLTICIIEAAAMLWFWPSTPTVIALFLSGFFYALNGLAHVWLEKRLFRKVLWEYVWVGVIVFFVLQFFSTWGK